MYLNQITAILVYLLGRRQRRALCPARVRVFVRSVMVVAAIMSARLAVAGVAQTGDVFPADNPFTLDVDEGIPDGNSVNVFEAINRQTFFEGRHTDGPNLADPTDDTNVNFNVIVGKTSFGTLLISGESALRDMDLIIGDRGTLNGEPRVGTGVVRITGFGSLYNNDPFILPAEVQNVPGFASQTPRLNEPGAATGFDVYVGRWGSGTLEITAGARAEIQDAVLVGDNGGATGNLIVDGIDSFLGNGGSLDLATSDTEFHMTIIGRQGTGNLTVSNGATMATQVFANGDNTVGASLGSTPYSVTLADAPDAGGNGTATITGNGSKWTIGGSLQVGGFDIGTSSGGVFSSLGDLEGDDTQYGSQAGRGTLNVNEGGLVLVQNAVGAVTGGGQDPNLVLAIGRFGVVKLGGGTIQIGSAQGGTQNQATPDTVQVINDGLITGTGRINTGVFRNRYLGMVRVDAGQSLVIDSSAEFSSTGGATPAEPLVNYGMIQVFGNSQAQAQLEFVRSPSESEPSNSVRPFVNLPLITDPPLPQPAFTGGQISAQYANLRFGSGLLNQSMLAFTAGTNNVTGRVVSFGLDDFDPSDDGGDGGDTAQVLVSGPGTTAIFHDDLSFGAGADLNLINGGKVVVLNQHSFTMAGNLNIELSYANPSLITVAGDVGIGPGAGNNDLSLSFASDALQTLSHGDAFQLISHTGDIGNVDVTVPTNPIVDYANPPLFTDIDVSPNVFALYGLVPQVQFADQGVYVVFLDPTMVGPGSGAIAPDFNGDGVVDLADFAIWQMHVGQMSGASVLDGDADGDGDVDGADFLKWQRNVGKPMPWLGSGAGSGSQLASVPEPASLLMIASGGALALAFGQRRSKR